MGFPVESVRPKKEKRKAGKAYGGVRSCAGSKRVRRDKVVCNGVSLLGVSTLHCSSKKKIWLVNKRGDSPCGV
eukprot:532546-Amorphochlora_amoeboformis.AAC.2